MDLQKKSELTVGRSAFVISTELAGDESPTIETRVLGSDGNVVFETSQDIAALKPIFQNSQKVFARLEAQHLAVVKDLEQGRIGAPAGSGSNGSDQESDALAHAVDLLGKRAFDKATAAFRAVLETYPNCSEARELLEVAYKAASELRLPTDIPAALKRGGEAFTEGRQREAIESWKQCLADEPENRRLQLLVLLATTWSPARREKYAAEVLAPGNRFLSSGRPEEAQALLLVTQTVEGTAAPAAEASEQTVVQSSDLESLVDEEVESQSEDSEAHDTVVTAPPAAPMPPAPSVPSGPSGEAAKRPADAPRPQPRTSPTQPRLAGRKPPPPSRRDVPWGMIAAAGLAAALAAGFVLWWMTRGPSVSPALLERAASLASSGQYAQAIATYDALLSDHGDSAAIYLGRGRAKLASGDNPGGLADLERALELEPESPSIAEELADLLYSQESYPAAIRYYEKAFAKGDGSAEGRYRLAVSLVREGRGDDAMQHLAAAVAKDPQHGEARFLHARLLNERGRYAEAEQSLRSAESHVEAGGDFLHQLGISLLEQQKLDEAEAVALKFLRGYPADARGRALLGEVYLNRKQYEPARAQLIQALLTNPNDPRAQLALGRTWLAIAKARGDAQDLAKAQQVLQSAQGVHEGRRLLALGQVSIVAERIDEAQNLLQRSLDRGAPELPVRLALAEAKWKAKDLVGSAEELQRASALAPGDPAIALSLAIAYVQLEDSPRAADQFLKAIQGVGLVAPTGEGSGPVVLPEPHVPLPNRFNVNRAIRDSCRSILKSLPDDPTATELTTLSESTTFLVGGAG